MIAIIIDFLNLYLKRKKNQEKLKRQNKIKLDLENLCQPSKPNN